MRPVFQPFFVPSCYLDDAGIGHHVREPRLETWVLWCDERVPIKMPLFPHRLGGGPITCIICATRRLNGAT